MIRVAIVGAVAVAVSAPTAAQQRTETFTVAPTQPIRVQLAAVPTGSLVTMLLRDIMRVPYVIAPDVLRDRDPISVDLRIPRDKIPERVVAFLRRSGFSVELDGGTVYVGKLGRARGGQSYSAMPSIPNGSPLSPETFGAPPMQRMSVAPLPRSRTDEETPQLPSSREAESAVQAQSIVAYLPAHREPSYLASILSPLFPELTFGARGEAKAQPSEQTIAPEAGPDTLVMAGSIEQLDRARRLIETLDRARPMVAVKAVVMSVSNTKTRGSALSIFGKLLGGNVELGIGGQIASGSQFVRIGQGALTAAFSVVREDSRFKVVATPNLVALSGGMATMNAGSQVPTVGAVSIAEGGTPVQSIVYRDSGITLTIRPIVRGELIELDVKEERSTFVRTTTGVEDSPTLQKSSASASVVLKSGESVVLAGLTEQSQGNTREGFLGGLLGTRTRDKSDSELLVVMQAELVPLPSVPEGRFVTIYEPETKGVEDEPAKPPIANPRRAMAVIHDSRDR